jgi:aspartyl aminopeptidase
MTYGGGLWHTWFDRDLILAGKLIVKNGDSHSTKLWRANKPLFKVPTLAIHLTT